MESSLPKPLSASDRSATNHVIIIGAMKCATTTLFDILSTHPKIAASEEKEPHFFANKTRQKKKIYDNYLDLWEDTDIAAGHFLLEASTNYTKWPQMGDVDERIRASLNKPKLIYVVRDPFDRIESDLNYSFDKRWFNPKLPPTRERYVRISDYFMQLSRYHDFYERGDLLIIDFDDIKSDISSVTARVSEFLGIEDAMVPPNRSGSNKTAPLTVCDLVVFRSPALHKAFWSLPFRVQEGLRTVMRLAPKADKVRLTPAERAKIHERLADGMRQFGETYEFNVSKWGF